MAVAVSVATPTASDRQEQMRRERRIAAPYRGQFAWRLVLEFVRDFGAWVAVIALGVAGIIPLWLGCLVNGWFAYLSYMTLHEATHGNISGHSGRRWADDVIGSLSSLPLWFSYRSHRVSHMKHHAHTNDPTRDPDHFIGGPFRQVFPKFALLSFLQIALPVLSLLPNGAKLLPEALRKPGSAAGETAELIGAYEQAIQRRFTLACVATFVVLSLSGYFWQALLLWYVPSRIGFFLIGVVFAWLPHHPHTERGRYRDTRVTLFPLATTLIRGQNHHVLHHMFPRVPHYSLPALFAEIRPMLESQGVRIEGIANGSAPAS